MTESFPIAGRTGSLTGLANEHSIAFGCAGAITGVTTYVDGGLHIRA
jgi:enoyl-[acyl-carrier-protein] reductase (NADH)